MTCTECKGKGSIEIFTSVVECTACNGREIIVEKGAEYMEAGYVYAPYVPKYVGSTIPEIDIEIETINVTPTNHKIKAKWSPELAEDLNCYHSLDAETELVKALSEQVALDLDKEIMNSGFTFDEQLAMRWNAIHSQLTGERSSVEECRGFKLFDEGTDRLANARQLDVEQEQKAFQERYEKQKELYLPVSSRYGKSMIRTDYYGTVIVSDISDIVCS